MSERICLAGLMAAAFALAGCQETPLEPTDTTPRDAVEIFTVPEPVYAVSSSGVTFMNGDEVQEYAFLASFDLILRANPDNAFTISVMSDSVLLQQLLTSPVQGPGGGVDRERYQHQSRGAGAELGPGGEISRGFDVWYTLPSGRRETIINVTLDFVDDRGVEFSRTHQLTVEPTERP